MAASMQSWTPKCVLYPSFERLSAARELSTPLQIGIRNTEGATVSSSTEVYQLYVSLYDAVYHCFFGCQWQGPVATSPSGRGGGGGGGAIIAFNQVLYMHTAVKSPSVLVVVELFSHNKEADGNGSSRSLGWGIMRPFSLDSALLDSSQNVQLPLKKLQFYKGTPRALYLMDEPLENCEHLKVIPGCHLTYTICTHRALFKVIHLLPENVFFSRNDRVPGLQQIGKSGDPFRKPKLTPTVMCQLHNVLVTVPPNVDRFEDELCQLLSLDYINNNSSNYAASTTISQNISIAERRLKVAVHNGWGYIGKEQTVHLGLEYSNGSNTTLNRRSPSPLPKQRSSYRKSCSSNSSTNAIGLVLKSPCYVENLVDSPNCAVVLSLEYVVTEPMMEEHMKLVHSMPRALKRVLLVRWCVWKPFDPNAQGQEMNGNMYVIPLMAGPSQNPDEVFVYKGPSTDMHDERLARMAPGTAQFHAMLHNQQMLGHSESNSIGEELLVKSENAAVQNNAALPPLPIHSPRLPQTKPNGPPLNQSLQSLQLNRGSSSYRASPAMMQTPAMYGMKPLYMSPYQQQQVPVGALPYGLVPNQYSAMMYDAQMSKLTEQVGAMTTNDLQELQHTPFQRAPVIAQIPHTTSIKNLSRANYSRLYNAGFPPLLDRNGDPPEVINPEKTEPVSHSINQLRDPLSCNEIVFHFLAFTKIPDTQSKGPGKVAGSVFFTFQFYKYPPVTTERLLLCEDTEKKASDQLSLYILHKANKDDTKQKVPPGYEVRYFVDPCFLKLGEFPLFLQHLEQQTLHVDVWNGDSLLLIGSCTVPLKYICRKGNEAVQCTVELDVLTTEYSEELEEISEDLGKLRDIQPYGVAAISKGQLHFKIANIGHPPTDFQESKKVIDKFPVKTHVIMSHLTGESDFHGGSLVAGNKQDVGLKKKVSLAGHLLHTHPELGSVITSHRNPGSSSTTGVQQGKGRKDDNTDERKRKLARMDTVRQQLTTDSKPATVLTYKQDLSQRARDLKMLDLYRQQTKRESIMNMLNSSITKEHVIYPCFGVAEFFEFVLRNPNNTQETVQIEFDDLDLSVITNSQEWRHFKAQTSVTTPVEEDMFVAANADSKCKQVFMRPKETLYIPFKFLSFSADQSVQPQRVFHGTGVCLLPCGNQRKKKKLLNLFSTGDWFSSPEGVREGPVDPFIKEKSQSLPEKVLSNDLLSRTIKIYFKTSSGGILTALSLRLEHQPHVVDQTFRFHQPEQSFLKKSIRLPPLHSLPGVPVGGAGKLQQVFVHCSDPNVICNSEEKRPGEPLDIFLKASVGTSPQVKKFFVAIYLDPFLTRPAQIWQFFIHALQRIDILCVEGQTSRFSLILRGTHSSRFARCFASHPQEMKLQPSEAFTLAAGSVHELHVAVRPARLGCKYFYINMVDIEYHQLLRSWLVYVKCQTPVISRAFELKLPVGGGRGCNKRISYTNPYSKGKVFTLHTNRDDLLQFKETQLDISGGEAHNIGLRFAPVLQPGCVEILVFINDDQDKNEETFCVKANYSIQTVTT